MFPKWFRHVKIKVEDDALKTSDTKENKTKSQLRKRLAAPIIPLSWSVWKMLSPMDVIGKGRSTTIFLCIGTVTNTQTNKQPQLTKEKAQISIFTILRHIYNFQWRIFFICPSSQPKKKIEMLTWLMKVSAKFRVSCWPLPRLAQKNLQKITMSGVFFN